MTDNPNELTIENSGMADVGQGLRLHYVEAGTGPRVAVLLHGYPPT
jgi:hypothetical protein